MSKVYYHQGRTIEIDMADAIMRIDGVEYQTGPLSHLFAPSDPIKEKEQSLLDYAKKSINESPGSGKRNNGWTNHIETLKEGEGVTAWNEWREKDPTIRPLLYDRDLTPKNLGKTLEDVNFSNAVLIGADLSGQNLRGANFHEANLGQANLHGADLTGANFCRADLYETKMPDAILTDANLQGAQLARTNFKGQKTKLIGCKVYGMSAWDLNLEGAEQYNLKVRYSPSVDGQTLKDSSEAELAIDDLQVAQLMYMLLNNQSLRTIISATTSRVVLILGRFADGRVKDLEKIRDELRKHGYVPIIFNFPPSENRDLTETIQLVANLAKFVIADLSDPRSIPQELSHIVPNLPSVPIQPILLASQKEYSMFEHWRRYPWVLPEFLYETLEHLIEHLDEKVIRPATSRIEWMSPQASLIAAKREIEMLKKELAEVKGTTL